MLVRRISTLTKKELRLVNTVILVKSLRMIRNHVIRARLVTLVILARRIVLRALPVYSRHQTRLQSANIVIQVASLQALPPCALRVNLERFRVSVLSYVTTASPARKKRITNVTHVARGASAVREPLSAILVVQLELTESKEKLLVMAARLANTLQRWGRHPRARARRVRQTRMRRRGAPP